MKKFLFAATVFFATLALAGGYIVSLSNNDLHAKANPISIGNTAPDFSLTDATGKTHKLSDYRGRHVVLEWTNPQCPYVVRHYKADTFEKMAKTYADKKVAWLAIDSSHFVSPEDAKKWQKDQGMSYATLLDKDGETGKAYGARTTPHMFVIDDKGVIQYMGAIDDDSYGLKKEPTNYVANALDSLIAGKPVAVSSTKPYGCGVKYK